MSSVSEYELGQLVGKYEESQKNIEGCLDKIDKSLEKGDKKMQKLDQKITSGFNDQKLENQTLHTEIEKSNSNLRQHKKKRHLFHVTDEETRRQRLKRHAPEIILGSILGTVASLVAYLKQIGVI